MGPCGNGKTTLVNHLGGSNLPAGDTPSSLTKKITELKTQFDYPIPFVVFDTPGTTSHIDKLQHATHLKCLLEYRPLNAICILVKFDGRYDELISNMFRQVKMLEDYKRNVVFLISHFDMAKKAQQAIKSINQSLNQLELDNQVVYFSNQETNQKQLCDSLFSICSKMNKIKIKIDPKVFYKYFNLKKEETQVLYFKKQQLRLIQEMKNIRNAYEKFALDLPYINQRDAILQDSEVELKNQLNEVLELFVSKYKNSMSMTEYFDSFFTLQLKINENLETYIEKTGSFYRQKSIQSTATGKQTDIRDLIKKCPNPECGLIWFRIEECPNTVCGKRPRCVFDFLTKSSSTYKFVRDKKTNEITFKKGSVKKQKKQVDKETQNRLKKPSLGCGQNMNFESLPRLPDIEEILKSWYQVKTIQEVIACFQRDKDMENTRKKFQDQANSLLKLLPFLGSDC